MNDFPYFTKERVVIFRPDNVVCHVDSIELDGAGWSSRYYNQLRPDEGPDGEQLTAGHHPRQPSAMQQPATTPLPGHHGNHIMYVSPGGGR